MAVKDFVSSGNNADLVKLIKDYALYLFRKDESFTPPASVDWTPPAGKRPVGYNAEDGAVLHPEPGDTTEIKAHNGDVVITDTAPGNWTLQIPGIESTKDIVEAYFGTKADENGALHVKDASTPEEFSWVLVALDQHENPIVVYGQRAKVTDRDDLPFSDTDNVVYNITLSMLKGKDGYQFHAFGILPSAARPKNLAANQDGNTSGPAADPGPDTERFETDQDAPETGASEGLA
ncbi:hypothetical protein BACT_0490 [Bifidobacterium actinocoloniiforme DSM 22766]|uniref:Phage major tail protein n=1 Tax=Bifidobacterium actinocoloniiforme DSM 22766 TaxID=1437605 RepID=A0A086YZU0_9BIFI|nr:hypothetical protein [Bifidobacterium actinocoloniiforme]KFI39790.1 hypothetical protein BACT_0490 [Bifidobacterium actinocoloniiforme DSM 22766]